jgi:hypothetical protein
MTEYPRSWIENGFNPETGEWDGTGGNSGSSPPSGSGGGDSEASFRERFRRSVGREPKPEEIAAARARGDIVDGGGGGDSVSSSTNKDRRIQRFKEEFKRRVGREPKPEEIAAARARGELAHPGARAEEDSRIRRFREEFKRRVGREPKPEEINREFEKSTYYRREDIERVTGKKYRGLKERVPAWQAKAILRQEGIEYSEGPGATEITVEVPASRSIEVAQGGPVQAASGTRNMPRGGVLDQKPVDVDLSRISREPRFRGVPGTATNLSPRAAVGRDSEIRFRESQYAELQRINRPVREAAQLGITAGITGGQMLAFRAATTIPRVGGWIGAAGLAYTPRAVYDVYETAKKDPVRAAAELAGAIAGWKAGGKLFGPPKPLPLGIEERAAGLAANVKAKARQYQGKPVFGVGFSYVPRQRLIHKPRPEPETVIVPIEKGGKMRSEEIMQRVLEKLYMEGEPGILRTEKGRYVHREELNIGVKPTPKPKTRKIKPIERFKDMRGTGVRGSPLLRIFNKSKEGQRERAGVRGLGGYSGYGSLSKLIPVNMGITGPRAPRHVVPEKITGREFPRLGIPSIGRVDIPPPQRRRKTPPRRVKTAPRKKRQEKPKPRKRVIGAREVTELFIGGMFIKPRKKKRRRRRKR